MGDEKSERHIASLLQLSCVVPAIINFTGATEVTSDCSLELIIAVQDPRHQ